MSIRVDGTVGATSKKPPVRLVWPLIVGACALTMTACTTQSNSSSGGATAPSSAVTAPSSAATSNAPSVVAPVIDVTTQPGSVPSYVGAMKDVTGLTCTLGADGITAAGTVTNPASTKQDYRIYISIVSEAQTLGVTEVDVNGVDPGASQQWSGVVAVQMDPPKCVLRVERNDSAA